MAYPDGCILHSAFSFITFSDEGEEPSLPEPTSIVVQRCQVCNKEQQSNTPTCSNCQNAQALVRGMQKNFHNVSYFMNDYCNYTVRKNNLFRSSLLLIPIP